MAGFLSSEAEISARTANGHHHRGLASVLGPFSLHWNINEGFTVQVVLDSVPK